MKVNSLKNNVKGKQLRKPVAQNFAPKRLAINFEPPMLILEYLVVDTGKLYHHKMRLDSVLRKPSVCRENVLLYIKTKHYLYFLNGKVSDQLLYKFIDKILLRKGKISKIDANNYNYTSKSEAVKYLNEDAEQQQYYEEDYEDFEDPSTQHIPIQTSKKTQQMSKNTFLTYCQEYEEEEEGEPQAEWDLDMDDDVDYV